MFIRVNLLLSSLCALTVLKYSCLALSFERYLFAATIYLHIAVAEQVSSMSTEQAISTDERRVAKTEGSRRAREDKVSLMQTDDYVCIQPATPLRQAIEVMKQDEGGCAIVCEGDKVVGMFTERDLLTKIIGEEIDLESPVSNWMSPAVLTLTPDATIGDAVDLMNIKSFRNIPLVKDGKLVGSISVFDVISYLAESYPKATMNLPPITNQVMEREDGG